MDEEMTLGEWLGQKPSILLLETRGQVLYGSWDEAFGAFTFKSQMCDIRETVEIPVEQRVRFSEGAVETEDRWGHRVRIVADMP